MATSYDSYRAAQLASSNPAPVGGAAPVNVNSYSTASQPNPTGGTASRADRSLPAQHTANSGHARPRTARARTRQAAIAADKLITDAITDYADLTQESQLAGYVRRQFEIMRRHRDSSGVSNRLLHCLRAYNGEYSPTQLAEIKSFGGSDAYARLTAVKCRTLVAMLAELYLGNERPWALEATPTPTLPDDITEAVETVAGGDEEGKEALLADALRAAKEKAASQAKAAADVLDDELVQGDFYAALGEFLFNFSMFPVGILKGPFYRATKKAKYIDGSPSVTTVTIQAYSAPSPFDIWFAPGVHRPGDGAVMERIRFAAQDLERLANIDNDTYNTDAIRACLATHPNGFVEAFTSSVEEGRRQEEERESPLLNDSGLYDVMEFHGWIRGDTLLGDPLTANMTPADNAPLDPLKFYHVTIRILSSLVISATFNPDPLERTIYHTASFEQVPGSVYGRGLPEALVDTQALANVAIRAVINNSSMACLPGDTVVYRENRNGKRAGRGSKEHPPEITLDHLWRQKHKHNSGLRRNVLRALDETTGRFIGQRVKDIHYNGERDVFRIRTKSGYAIEATHTHRFMSADGQWRTLDNFAPGDLIAVNGASTPLADRRSAIRESHPTVDAATLPPTAVMTPEQAYADHEVHAVRAQATGSVLLLPTAHTCHDHFGTDPFLHHFINYDRIISIEYVGVKQVYDLEMVDPHHNFIANGFVSHNSAPQVGINNSVISEVEAASQIHPWKIWNYVVDPAAPTAPPIVFFQPQDNTGSLMNLLEKAMQLADEVSAIPRYASGSDRAGGAARTASGLAQLQGNVARVVRFVAKGIDDGVLAPVLAFLYDMKLLTDSTNTFRGDETIRPMGVQAAQKQEAERMRAIEFGQLTNNALDAQLMGPEGRLVILKEIADNLGFDEKRLSSIFDKRLRELEKQGVDPTQAAPGQGNQAPAPKDTPPDVAAPIQGMTRARSLDEIDRVTGGAQRN